MWVYNVEYYLHFALEYLDYTGEYILLYHIFNVYNLNDRYKKHKELNELKYSEFIF